MAEYIKKDDVLKEIESVDIWSLPYGDLYEAVQDMSSADVALVRHGRWIKESDGGTRCSVCNQRVRDVTDGVDEPVNLSDMPYCPKCGARMDGDCYADD